MVNVEEELGQKSMRNEVFPELRAFKKYRDKGACHLASMEEMIGPELDDLSLPAPTEITVTHPKSEYKRFTFLRLTSESLETQIWIKVD
jgi:hypothetical protein